MDVRRDPLSGEVVIVAEGRADRPFVYSVAAPALPSSVADCPFCEGNEGLTPPEVARVGPGEPDTPGWRIRVVPNKYPIVAPPDGVHEVVMLSPAHDHDLAALDHEQRRLVWRMMRDRCARHLESGFPYVTAFVNHGRAAGASIEHPHAQVVALGFEPPSVTAAGVRAITSTATNLVLDGAVLAWCPSVPVWTFETIVARPDSGPFHESSDAALDGVSDTVHDMLNRLLRTIGHAPYNVVVHTATEAPSWYVQIVPRLGVRAGFEFATDVSVTVVPPEQAAELLRDAAEQPDRRSS